MIVDEKGLMESVAKAVAVLPDAERRYLCGYAEGVIAARSGFQSRPAPPTFPPTSGPEGGPTPVGCPAP